MQKKYIVLNMNYQPLNPVQFGFKKPSEDDDDVPPAYGGQGSFLLEEEEAKKFAEHMARTQGVGNQKFHLFELKGTAQQTQAPIEWV